MASSERQRRGLRRRGDDRIHINEKYAARYMSTKPAGPGQGRGAQHGSASDSSSSRRVRILTPRVDSAGRARHTHDPNDPQKFQIYDKNKTFSPLPPPPPQPPPPLPLLPPPPPQNRKGHRQDYMRGVFKAVDEATRVSMDPIQKTTITPRRKR